MFKKLSFILLTVLMAGSMPSLSAQSYDATPYCTFLVGQYSTARLGGITDVSFGPLNVNHPVVQHNNEHAAAPNLGSSAFIYYDNVTAPILTRNLTYTLTVTSTSQTLTTMSAWIDWNQNGTFETAEGMDLVDVTYPGETIGTIDIEIPASAVCGITRMKIGVAVSALKISTYAPMDATLDPCFIFANVNVDIHDYDIFINDPSNPTNPDGTPNTDCSVPVELSEFTATATMTGVQLDWITESEIENLGFTLERKTENTSWTEIASYKTNDALLGQGTVSHATDYSYIDNLVVTGTTYEYRLADVDYNGVVTYHSTREVIVEQSPLAKVEEFTVLPAYPNPFNPSTTIRYNIPVIASEAKQSPLSIQIYDITGKLISTLLNGEQTPGWHSVTWNGTNQHGEQVPAGVYLSRITSGNNIKTNKLMLLK